MFRDLLEIWNQTSNGGRVLAAAVAMIVTTFALAILPENTLGIPDHVIGVLVFAVVLTTTVAVGAGEILESLKEKSRYFATMSARHKNDNSHSPNK